MGVCDNKFRADHRFILATASLACFFPFASMYRFGMTKAVVLLEGYGRQAMLCSFWAMG